MRPITLTLALLLLLAAIFSSCEPQSADTGPGYSTAAAFEGLWEDFDLHYSGFAAQPANWDSLYAVYRPQVGPATTELELWLVLTGLLNALNDEHVKLYDDEHQRSFVSGFEGAEATAAAFSLELVAQAYLQPGSVGAVNDFMLYGKSADGKVGYLYIAALLDEDHSCVARALQAMGPVEALVVDLRGCVGGYDRLGGAYAAYFSDGVHHLYDAHFRSGEAHQDFAEKEAYHTYAPVEGAFNRPVVLLTDRLTISEGEIFALNMKAFDHVTHMGGTTAGALSLVGPARFLPNGWRYEYSVQLITAPDGSTLEGIGIAPEFPLSNLPEEVAAGQDRTMEAARQFLKDAYGI